MDDLARGLDIVVAAVDDYKSGVVQLTILVVVQAAVLRHDAVLHIRRRCRLRSGCGRRISARRVYHLAVIGKGVALLRQEAVRLAYPVAPAMDDLARGLDIVVAAVDDYESGVVQLAVLVIVQAAVLRYDAVLHIRCRCRLRSGGRRRVLRRCRSRLNRRVDHSALFVERIVVFRHQAVCLGDPICAVLYGNAHQPIVVIGEIVVAAVDKNKSGIIDDDPVFDQVCVLANVVQAGSIYLPHAVFIEYVEHILALDVERIRAGRRISAGAEVILVSVDLGPLLCCPLAGPHILDALRVADKVAPGQDAVDKGIMISADDLLTIECFARAG